MLFVYDEAGHLLGEYDDLGNAIRQYVWLNDRPVAMLKANGASTDVYYIHSDHLNTPKVVTDQSQSVVWKGDYKPFGDVAKAVSTIEMPLRFPGQYEDDETELNYNYFRSYGTSTGRYTQSDPIGLLGGLNTYAYAKLDPVNRFDAFGLQSECNGCEQTLLDCVANCIRKLDPMNNLEKLLLTAAGGTFPKAWGGMPRGLGGASPMTTVPSTAAHAMGGGTSATGSAMRSAGRFMSPVWITYGVYLAGMELYCLRACLGNQCAY